MKGIRFILLGVIVLLFINSAAFSAVIRVKPTGNDANDGSTWALAKATVQGAIDTATAWEDEIWVAAGTYTCNITVPAHISLYGGFDGNEVTRKQRNFWFNKTILDGGASSSVITVEEGATTTHTRIDGFTIQNGFGSGSGILLVSTSPTIVNNYIIENNGVYGSGIYCAYSNALIMNNGILDNTGSVGAGIYCTYSSPRIVGNVFGANEAAYSGGGIYCTNSSPKILNNTFAGNQAPLGTGGGIRCADNSSPMIVNNIIAYSGDGGGVYGTGGSPAIHHNCLYSNQPGGDFMGTWSEGWWNVYENPQIIELSPESGDEPDIHLRPTSPCVDAGTSAILLPADRDIDKQKRFQGHSIDIGADEVAIQHIDLDGDREGDMLGWTAAGKIYYTVSRIAWTNIPGTLQKLVTGDLNDDGKDDVVGLNSYGKVYYSTNKTSWTSISDGRMSSIITGDFNGDGYDDIAGLDATGKIYYTTDLSHWTNIPGTLTKLLPLRGDTNGTDDIIGLSDSGAILYTTNLTTLESIPTQFTNMVVGDIYGDGSAVGIGLKSNGTVWRENYADDNWAKLPGTVSKLAIPGDFNGDGYDDILALSGSGKIYASYDAAKLTWTNIPGILSSLVTGDYNRDGVMDIAGLKSTGEIRYTIDKSTWLRLPGKLANLCPGRYAP